MKNLFKFLMSVAILFTASCAKEDISSSIAGGEVEVSFTANLADLGTRAYGKAEHITTLHYFVYDQNGTLLNFDGDDVAGSTTTIKANQPATVTLPLIKGMTYKLAFWADNGSYNITDNVVSVNYGAANNDTLDAFYYLIESFDPAKAEDQDKTTVTLKRPFAQLNALTNDAAAVALSGVDIETSTVKVVAYTQFNVANGDVVEGAFKEIEFDATAIPTETLEGKETLKYLSMNYILVPKAGHVSNVEFTFTGSKNVTFEDTKYDNVPFKQNYRTNIFGSLLTKPTEFNVTIETDFDTPDEERKVVNNAAELQTAIANANNGDVIVLASDIDLNDLLASLSSTRAAASAALTIPAGKNLVLNLNGKTLAYENTEAGVQMIENLGTLTVTGGGNVSYKYAGTPDSSHSKGNAAIRNIGTLVIDGSTVENVSDAMSHASYAIDNFATLTVESNSNILNNNGHALRVATFNSSQPNVAINGGHIKGTRAVQLQLPGSVGSVAPETIITINGGTLESNEETYNLAFYGYSNGQSAENVNIVINDGTFNGNVALNAALTNSISAGGLTVNGGTFNGQWGVFTYSDANDENTKIAINNGAFVNLANAIGYAAEGAFISPACNLELTEGITIANGETLTLDLAGKTISGTDNATGSFGLFTNRGNLTIKDSVGGGKIQLTATNNRGWNGYSSVISNTVGGVLVVNGGTIEHLGGTDMAYGIDNLTNGKGTSAVTTINGGTVKSPYIGIRQFLNGIEATNSLTVNGGEIWGTKRSIWMQGPSANANTGSLVVTDNAMLYGNAYFSTAEGTTEWPIKVSINNAALKDESTVAHGYLPAGYAVVNQNGVWTVELSYADYIENDTVKGYVIYSANGLKAVAEKEIKGGYKILLGADIDLTGVEFNGLRAFNSENNNTFDGQNHTVSNWTNNSGASDMGFIKSWVGTIKNVKFENCHLKTAGRSAIAAANVYGNIENVHVNNCYIEDSYWACGLIAGLYNAGNISNCSATNSSVKSNGGTGGIVGVINETAGTRSLTNCSVSNTTVNNTGVYGEDYSGAPLCGMINISNSTVKFVGCSHENNTKEGQFVGNLYYAAGDDITIVLE